MKTGRLIADISDFGKLVLAAIEGEASPRDA
jgi:hypothetical protein